MKTVSDKVVSMKLEIKGVMMNVVNAHSPQVLYDKESRQEYKEMRHKAKKEVVKAKDKAYGKLYKRLEIKEGERPVMTG